MAKQPSLLVQDKGLWHACDTIRPRGLVANFDSGGIGHVKGVQEGLDLYYETNTHWTIAGDELAGKKLGDAIVKNWLSNNIDSKGIISDRFEQDRHVPDEPETSESRLRARRDFLIPLIRDEYTRRVFYNQKAEHGFPAKDG